MEALLSHCSAAISGRGSLLAVFFMAGVTGGFTHCLPMCGPIVASEASQCRGCGQGACGSRRKAADATQISYHLGRATTYGALGFLAALFARQLQAFAFWPWLSAFMLACAGVMFLASSLDGCKHSAFLPSGRLTYIRGTLLGFMPCGLLYAALMMAATLSHPLSGMVAMWLFVLGTIPALLLASIGTTMLTRKWQSMMLKAGRAMMVFNGLSLFVMAGKLVRI